MGGVVSQCLVKTWNSPNITDFWRGNAAQVPVKAVKKVAAAIASCVGPRAHGCTAQNCVHSVDILVHRHQQSVCPALSMA